MKEETNFFTKVFQVCQQIPRGRVTSYGAIAKAIGWPQSARMVGWAMNKSFTYGEEIPAHRVLNRVGMLTGKKAFGNPNLMQQLLEKEGIPVKNDQVQNFKKYFWDPNEI
ncbi:MAG: cysteine methyltransferase [Bacteroidetes bacterium]|nr:MAG: cysteine methyltransferase [Bacteroidota bacterium]